MDDPRAPGTRSGRPRVYGETRIDLAKRAGQRRGWTTSIFDLYGKRAKKRYKTSWRCGGPSAGQSGWCWWRSRVDGWPSSAPTCQRP